MKPAWMVKRNDVIRYHGSLSGVKAIEYIPRYSYLKDYCLSNQKISREFVVFTFYDDTKGMMPGEIEVEVVEC